MFNIMIAFLIFPIVLGIIAFVYNPSMQMFFYGYITAIGMLILFGLLDGELNDEDL